MPKLILDLYRNFLIFKMQVRVYDNRVQIRYDRQSKFRYMAETVTNEDFDRFIKQYAIDRRE